MPETRPSNVHCVAKRPGPYGDAFGKTWCGRPGVYTVRTAVIPHPTHVQAVRDALVLRPGERASFVAGDTDITITAVRQPVFLDAEDALMEVRRDGAFRICPACSAAMRAVLDAGTWTG